MRLIDADKLDWWYKGRPIRRVIDEAPTIDAIEVVHGKWVSTGGNQYTILRRCSICCAMYDFTPNYCPNCGAKMDGDGNG